MGRKGGGGCVEQIGRGRGVQEARGVCLQMCGVRMCPTRLCGTKSVPKCPGVPFFCLNAVPAQAKKE